MSVRRIFQGSGQLARARQLPFECSPRATMSLNSDVATMWANVGRLRSAIDQSATSILLLVDNLVSLANHYDPARAARAEALRFLQDDMEKPKGQFAIDMAKLMDSTIGQDTMSPVGVSQNMLRHV